MNNQNTEKLWTLGFIIVCFINLFIFSSMTILNSTLPIYVDSLGGNASFTGILTVIFAITAITSRLISGRLTDSKGSRIIMIVGSLIFALSTIAFNIAPLLWTALLFRFLQGIGFAAVNTAAAAAAAEILPKNRIGEGLGYYGMGQSIAMAAGPLIGLSLISGGNFKIMFLITSLIIFTTTLLSIGTGSKKKAAGSPADSKTKSVIAKPEKAIPASFIQGLIAFAQSSVVTFITLYALESGVNNAGLFFLVAAVAMVIVRLFTGRIYDKYGALPVLIPGMLLGIIGYCLIAFFSNPVTFLISGVMYGINIGVCLPTLNSVAIKSVPRHRLGVASATFYLSIDIGIGIGGVFWGFLIDFSGYTAVYGGAGICVLLALLFSLFVLSKRQENAAVIR